MIGMTELHNEQKVDEVREVDEDEVLQKRRLLHTFEFEMLIRCHIQTGPGSSFMFLQNVSEIEDKLFLPTNKSKHLKYITPYYQQRNTEE